MTTNKDLMEKLIAAEEVILEYLRLYPAFRSKPVGAPHSEARALQDAHIELETRALNMLPIAGYK